MNQIGSIAIVGKENQAPSVTLNSLPQWLTATHAHLTTQDLGVEWGHCIEAWVLLEASVDYGQKSKV